MQRKGFTYLQRRFWLTQIICAVVLLCTPHVLVSVSHAFSIMRKILPALAMLAPVSGFVTSPYCRARTSRGSMAESVRMASAGALDVATEWALIFDCDGVILEVQLTDFVAVALALLKRIMGAAM